MEWLETSISISCLLKFVVFAVLVVRYTQNKNKVILYWMIGWLFFSLFALFELFTIWVKGGFWNDFWMSASYFVFALTAVVLLQSTIYMKSGKIIEKYRIPLVLAVIAFFFALIGVFIIKEWPWCALLPMWIGGIALIATGIYFGSYAAHRGNPAAYVVSVALVLHGAHFLDYPFLRPVEWFAPYGFWIGSVFSSLFAVGSIMLVFPKWYLQPITEVAKPTAKKEKIEEKYELELHQSYLVKEEKPRKSFEIFVNEIEHGAQGLIVTRQYPDKVRKKYGLEKTPIIWLSTKLGDNNIDPTNIATLIHVIVNFIQKSEDSILLVDAVEYLVANNDFQIILRAIERLNEVVMQCNSRMMISLDPRTLEMNEVAILGRNMEVIEIS